MSDPVNRPAGAIAPNTSRRRRWLLPLALGLVSTALSLGIAEVVCRFLVPSTVWGDLFVLDPDPALAFALAPGADIEFDGIGIQIPPTRVQVSQQGLRGGLVAVPKPPGVRRLLCVGDSVTFGWGVPVSDSFCSRLAALLGPPWETINLGVPGYNTGQEVRRLERVGLAFEPDAVVVQFDGNDFEPVDVQADSDSTWAWLVDHSALCRWLHMRLSGGPRRVDDQGGDQGEGQGPGPADATSGVAAVTAAFDRLQVLSRGRFTTLVAMRARDVDKALLVALADRQIPVLDLAPALYGPPDQIEIPGDGHPTAEGHRRIAVAIAQELRARGFLR